jgi:hypothetical protein
MNFKDMLDKLSLLSEATKETDKGRVHKADPGGYGRKYDTDEEGEEKKDDKKEPAAKRGRGRPKKGADDSGEVKKYDNAKKLQDFMIGNKPKKSKELDKLPGKKHTLKDWFEAMDKKMLEEATGQNLAVKPLPGATQLVDPASNKVVATGPADKIKALQGSVAKGEVTMTGKEEMAEEGGDKWIQKAVKHPGAFTKKAKSHGMSTSAFASKVLANKDKFPAKTEKQAQLAKTLGKLKEADIPSDQVDMGAGLGAGRSQSTFEAKEDKKAMKKDHKAEKMGKKVTKDMEKVEEAAKPDYIDLDKDGNKKESMKKAAADKKKKKVNESMHKHTAARLLGKAHALAKEGYNCRYEDMDEARCYHEGFKEGLDECYGVMPVQGLVGETGVPGAPATPPATTGGMAQQAVAQPAMEDDMEEGNAFTGALAKADKGEKFTVGGKTFTDTSSLEEEGAFAFEALDNQLNALLTESEEVTEGMSVSISKGQQGMPDTVSVSAQDGEAEQLLSFIKQAGLGLFGDGGPASNYGAPEGDSSVDHGGIKVVGDHDGMMGLMKKIAGMEQGSEAQDYESEEGSEEGHEEHGHDEPCEACGQSDCGCDESAEMVDEVETDDQRLEQVAETDMEELKKLAGTVPKREVAEANPPDSGAAETTADENAEAAEDQALAAATQQNKTTTVNEWANDAGQSLDEFREETFEADIDFMMNVISSGLNKKKSTGQQTIPVLAGDEERTNIKEGVDPLDEWKALSGIK